MDRAYLQRTCAAQLEFDDVFLVDFFKDSPASSEWRVLLSFLDDMNGRSPDGRPLTDVSTGAPPFVIISSACL